MIHTEPGLIGLIRAAECLYLARFSHAKVLGINPLDAILWLNICVNTCEEKFMCCHTCFKCTEIDRLQKPAKHASLQPSELET